MFKISQLFDLLVPRLFLNLGGGGGGPTSSTVTQSNVPDWLRPQVEGMLGQAAQSLFQTTRHEDPETGEVTYDIGGPRPYTPWNPQGTYLNAQGQLVTAPGATVGEGRQYVAQLQPGQQQALGVANWLGQGGIDPVTGQPLGGLGLVDLEYGRAGDFAKQAGYGGQYAAGEALGYGQRGAGFGQTAADLAKEKGQYYGGYGHSVGALAGALAPAAQAYGEAGAQYGRAGQEAATKYGGEIGGLGIGYGAGAAGLTPRAAGLGGMYEQMVTTPGEQLKYMSPYQQAVTAQQQAGAIRQKQVADQARKAAAARAGAFGGGRQAIESAEADRALQTQLGNIEAQGLQSAYQQAQQNILNRAQLEAQGLGQAGQLYGVGMQGAQVGLQGLDRQLAGAQLGMQGAGMGLQGLGQANQLYGTALQGAGMGLQGLQQQLAGQQLGMQGAGMGLQGVQTGLGGYGLMGQAGTQLANITAGRLRDVMGIGQYQYGMGEQQRQLEQQAINQAIQNFAMQQETPYQRLAAYNALIRGYAQPGQTMTQYQAPPSGISQLAALGTAGIGLGQLANVAGIGKKEGGTVHSGHGLDRLALRNALAGN